MSQNHFADQPMRPDIVRFVSVLSKRPRSAPSTPMSFPSSGKWLLKILARENRFVFGVYRRHMKVISYLGTFDRLFGAKAALLVPVAIGATYVLLAVLYWFRGAAISVAAGTLCFIIGWWLY